jgi:hypothetical protein
MDTSMIMARQWYARTSADLYARSVRLVAPLEDRFGQVLMGWTVIVALACLLRILFPVTPSTSVATTLEMTLPHVAILISPFAAYWTANHLFPRDRLFAQPEIRLALVGRWKSLDVLTARDNPVFGPTGLMASLLIGMLLNVPVRTVEFMTAIPALNSNAPHWGQMIFQAMTFDLVLMNFLYTLCFFMALRRMPFFPRMLLLTWGIDITSQLLMTDYLASAGDLPAEVASALAPLVDGNVKKVFISMIIWLPYLLLSERVNITYRWRTAAK